MHKRIVLKDSDETLHVRLHRGSTRDTPRVSVERHTAEGVIKLDDVRIYTLETAKELGLALLDVTRGV